MADRKLSADELASSDGKEGRPAYIAHDGKVYDVSESKLWRQGQHVRRHHAGNDLTVDIGGAPHGPEVFERVPQVGELVAAEAEPEEVETGGLERWLDLYFSIHPHPVSVHFPIAYVAGMAVLLVLYLITGVALLETVAYYVLVMGVIMTPLAMLAGFVSWWFNYGHKMTRTFGGKIGPSIGLLILGVAAWVLRATNPGAVIERTTLGWVYLGIVALMVVHVAVLGWIGARIAFPSTKKG